ncbi:MAG: hypothetical protein V1774_10790 [Candidatus Eisenbacteria bacterium]
MNPHIDARRTESSARSAGRRRPLRVSCTLRRHQSFLAWAPASALLAAALGALPAPALYDDDDVRAILLNQDRAQALDAPLVLLAHETRLHLLGSGPQERNEHWIWYVADPAAPSCRALQTLRIRLDVQLDRLELIRCRIYRDDDTLMIPLDSWHLGVVPGWPPQSRVSWNEASCQLPELRAGDGVEVAYTIHDRWSTTRVPLNSAWVPIGEPGVPTIERHIVITHPSVLSGRAIVVGDAARVVRHHGNIEPMLELLTGNLPPAPADPLDPGSPRLLFSAETEWDKLRQTLKAYYGTTAHIYGQALKARADSISSGARSTRARVAAALEYVEGRFARVPPRLLESRAYPRTAPVALEQDCADPLDRAMLVAGLADAAHVKVEILLAASTAEGFRSEFAMPQQFDRILLGFEAIDEGRFVLIDPWQPDLTQALEAAGAPVLFGITEDVAGFREVNDEGRLVAREAP